MALSQKNHKIKHRENPNDVFITPLELAKTHIDMIHNQLFYVNTGDCWYDPFKNSGSYYNQFPHENKKWSEILENKDFFEFNEEVDIICSNPPYSMINKVLEKSVELKPKVISYLLGINNLTAKRMEFMEKHGYYITKIHMCKVFKWFGMSVAVVWEKNGKPIISYDRVVWR
tara:strand:- start:232 stop:747 length:516 start_codon:yes stop_codon:yes gene_type:complete